MCVYYLYCLFLLVVFTAQLLLVAYNLAIFALCPRQPYICTCNTEPLSVHIGSLAKSGNCRAVARLKIDSALLEQHESISATHTLLVLELHKLTGTYEHESCKSKNEGAAGPVLSE